MRSADLLAHAGRLCQASPKRPRQVDLCRAVSAAYYALFHELCEVCADTLIGTKESGTEAWRLAYRAVDHRTAKDRCKARLPLDLPMSIASFAATFVILQEERHRSDYDPRTRFSRSEALSLVETARRGVRTLQISDLRSRRAFAAHILFRPR